jgi:hypothetical protein
MRPYRSPPHACRYSGNDPQLMDNFDIPAHIWDAARDELGPWASDWQIERRALELAREAIDEGGPDYD